MIKITKKVEQVAKVSSDGQQITENIYEVIKKFDLKISFKKLDAVKRSGILVSTIGMALLALPFIGKSTIADIMA